MNNVTVKIKEYHDKISSAENLNQLDTYFLELFGKNGIFTLATADFKNLNKDEVSKIAPLVINAKKELETAITKKREEIKEESYKKIEQEDLDLTETNLKPRKGYLHPLTKFENEIVELFSKLGFQIFAAPHIDTDYFNFEVLNIPKDHPARDLWDTLYIDKSNLKPTEDNLILRTHTSNAQVRIMKQNKPPIRMMVLDRCFRYENLDARHEHTFDQFELVYVDKGLSMANLQYLSEYFLKSVLGDDIKVRMRPKYYPFVEPGVGIDGTCIFCKGQGCRICGGVGWLELGGAGMIHPKVLENGGYDPDIYSGIAWGPGLERILMLKYHIDDLRVFRNGDLKFLQELGEKSQ